MINNEVALSYCTRKSENGSRLWPCPFYSQDPVLSEVSSGHEQSCPLDSFGLFEKEQYSNEINPKTFLREEALYLCYLELEPILGLCMSLG